MSTEIRRPETFFLEKFGLTEQTLERTLGAALGKRIDDADLYFEYRVNEEIGLEEGIVKKAARSISQGASVRATAEEKTGFAYSDEITVEDLQLAAQRARYIAAESGHPGAVAVCEARLGPRDLYPVQVPPTDVPIQRKIDLLQQIDRIARAHDPRISKVMASLASEHKVVLVATSEGWVVGDVRLGPGWPGILLHEAIGHGLEGDFNRKGTSAFTGRIGERVASPLCTVVDDGTMPGRRGSLDGE